MKLHISLAELDAMGRRAKIDYDQIHDDGTAFPKLSPMKSLKLSFFGLYQITEAISDTLKKMIQDQESGQPDSEK